MLMVSLRQALPLARLPFGQLLLCQELSREVRLCRRIQNQVLVWIEQSFPQDDWRFRSGHHD